VGTRYSVLDGMDLATLQGQLTAMQTALLALQTGSLTVSVSYSQGDGSRSVTYSQANIGSLTQAILNVQQQIDILNGVAGPRRRRPIMPVF
jgi:hypothetical protein